MPAWTAASAQQVVAHEYGYSSWQALTADATPDRAASVRWTERHRHYETLVDELVAPCRAGDDERFGSLGRRLRERLERLPGEPGVDADTQAACQVVAQANGCETWAALNIEVLAAAAVFPVADRPQLDAFERAHNRLGPLLAEGLSTRVAPGASLAVDTAFVDVTSYGELLLSLISEAQLMRLRAQGIAGELAIGVGSWVPTLVEQAGSHPERLAVCERLLTEATAHFLSELGGGRAEVVEGQAHPLNGLAMAPMFEMGVLIAQEVCATTAGGSTSGLVRFFYSAKTVRSLAERL